MGKLVRFSILFSIVFSILFIFSALSFANGVYVQTNNGKVWDAYPEQNQVPVWTGGIDSNGYASGQGVMIWYQDGQPGDKYEGTMVEGKMSGKGTYTWFEGTKYVGDFVDFYRDGYGTYYDKNGNVVYQGKWSKDQFMGNK
ncbi:MORN repeat-containing protein [Thermodesulfobium acidiphilum]|uniref:MORN repeat-containing protein n=1 Tax=Thermodesulfobium acidiphilum TaxID=1794699 RepID=A0A2R4W2Y6_THEAF|nr:hypothetical protein [Thermodesulfobium acidiphilum]AWB11032.1 MORN repeat-containing protein [Thermodesulfobium acidiphilum]